jgi:DnaJ-class molecular chaperone
MARGWRPDFTATFARANARLADYMAEARRACVYCSGSGTVLQRAEFRGGRLFPVVCPWCHGTGRRT